MTAASIGMEPARGGALAGRLRDPAILLIPAAAFLAAYRDGAKTA